MFTDDSFAYLISFRRNLAEESNRMLRKSSPVQFYQTKKNILYVLYVFPTTYCAYPPQRERFSSHESKRYRNQHDPIDIYVDTIYDMCTAWEPLEYRNI